MPTLQSFTTGECAWAQTQLKFLGRTVTGSMGFEFDYDIDKEHLFGAGSKPLDIQSGNEKLTGNLKVLKYEFDGFTDAAQLAGYSTLAHVPHPLILITCSYKKFANSKMRIIEANGVSFMKMNVGMEQNAKHTLITLPFLAMAIRFL